MGKSFRQLKLPVSRFSKSTMRRAQKEISNINRQVKKFTRKRQRVSSSSSSSSKSTAFVAASASGNSFSRFRTRGRNNRVSKKLWKGMAVPSALMVDNNWRLESSNGEQAVTYVPHLDSTNLGTCFTNSGILINNNGKIYLSKYTSEMYVTNQGMGNTRMTLYDIVCRRDTTESNPVSAWNDGLLECTGTSANTRTSSNLNSTPFQSPEFCTKWKVVKRTVVQMALGQSHIHKVDIKFGSLISRDNIEDFVYQKGLSFVTLVVIHGMPCNEQATQTDVAVSSAFVSIVRSQKVHYRAIMDNQNQYAYQKNQAALSDQYMVNSKSGQAEAGEEA